ncbi:MAG TPA: YHS domain-containing protein [Anaerolineales bacterium]|jgi:YHS domain-containing protein|nr:YHS domain-containing protein [Anaerolineales bacterium]
MLKDPVCGKRLNHNKAHILIEYNGVQYALCCPKCQSEFEHSPQTYAKPELGEKVKKIAHPPHRRPQS